MNPNKPPSLHDILASAGDLNTMQTPKLRLLCNALIAFAFQAHDKQLDAEGREQATYLAFVRAKAEAQPTVRVPGPATTALLRKRKRKTKGRK